MNNLHFTILSLLLSFGFMCFTTHAQSQILIQEYNQTCNSTTFCNKAAGLICNEEFRCDCSYGIITDTLPYNFTWNEELNKCLGIEGSGCITAEEATTAKCNTGLVCTQAENLPPMVGTCTVDPASGGSSAGHFTGSVFVILAAAALSIFTVFRN